MLSFSNVHRENPFGILSYLTCSSKIKLNSLLFSVQSSESLLSAYQRDFVDNVSKVYTTFLVVHLVVHVCLELALINDCERNNCHTPSMSL